ncbi:MAG TPA: LLM class flavin-dependent oxidoreductase [Thermomicrobiaceae bacterium]|nr:LLM class flavin-dependent oxidoreductase [Thermomicrobiaceae bacterium]
MAVDFGLVLQPGWRPLEPAGILDFNRQAIARLSDHFTALWAEDHLQKGANPALEAWTTLAFLAGEYSRYRLGTLVLGQSYRNPGLLAKMAATLHYLSGGRLILGIGAGWQEDEYQAFDYPFPPAGVRIAQLAEAVELIRTLWAGSPATYQGRYYRVEEANCEPRLEPPPPIMIGAHGEKILKVVARLADGWNTAGPYARYRQRDALLRRECEAIGRNPDEITRSVYVHAWLTSDSAAHAQAAARLGDSGIDLLGPTSDDAIRQLRPYVELGVSHIQVKPYDLPTIERISDEVAPAVTG